MTIHSASFNNACLEPVTHAKRRVANPSVRLSVCPLHADTASINDESWDTAVCHREGLEFSVR